MADVLIPLVIIGVALIGMYILLPKIVNGTFDILFLTAAVIAAFAVLKALQGDAYEARLAAFELETIIFTAATSLVTFMLIKLTTSTMLGKRGRNPKHST